MSHRWDWYICLPFYHRICLSCLMPLGMLDRRVGAGPPAMGAGDQRRARRRGAGALGLGPGSACPRLWGHARRGMGVWRRGRPATPTSYWSLVNAAGPRRPPVEAGPGFAGGCRRHGRVLPGARTDRWGRRGSRERGRPARHFRFGRVRRKPVHREPLCRPGWVRSAVMYLLSARTKAFVRCK